MSSFVIVDIFSLIPLLFTIYLAKRHLSGSRQNWYYILASVLAIMQLLLEIITYSISGIQTTQALAIHYLGYALGYALAPALPFEVLFYLGYSEQTPFKKFILSIPLLVNMILSVLSIQSGWYFKLNLLNIYERGPIFWMVTIISAFYYMLILIRLITKRNMTIIVSKFLLAAVYLLPIVATALQLMVMQAPFIYSTVSITLLLYYIVIQEAKFDYDMQTKVRNRIAFEQELHTLERTKRDACIFMFDVNNLKQTNDTWGHQEGDTLLVAVAAMLSKFFSPAGKVFRIGGDEFCAILPLSKTNEESIYARNIEKALEKANAKRVHPINIAYGWASSNIQEGVSIAKAFNQADDAMYLNKAACKKQLVP